MTESPDPGKTSRVITSLPVKTFDLAANSHDVGAVAFQPKAMKLFFTVSRAVFLYTKAF
jgi:hypothetical protein